MLLLSACAACAHDVSWLADEPQGLAPPRQPIGLTIAVDVQSFEAKRLAERPFVERFAQSLREARLFQGVIHPIPDGFEPRWEIKLLVRDELIDPDSNFWKSALATAFLPLRFFLYQQEDYIVDVEALVTWRKEVVGSYTARGSVRHRFQAYDPRKELAAAELIVERTTQDLLAQIGADAERIDAEDRTRAGR